MTSNKSLERPRNTNGHAALAMDSALAGVELAPCQAAQQDR